MELLQEVQSILNTPNENLADVLVSSPSAISADDVTLANQLRQLRFKRVDLDIIKYLKAVHQELYVKLKSAVISSKKTAG